MHEYIWRQVQANTCTCMCTHSLIRVHTCVYTQYTHVFKSYICTIHTYTMYTIHTDTHVYAYAYMHVHNNLRIIFVHIIFIQRISHQDNLGSTYLYIHIQHISVYSYTAHICIFIYTRYTHILCNNPPSLWRCTYLLST